MLILLNNTCHFKTKKEKEQWKNNWPEKTIKHVIKILHWVASLKTNFGENPWNIFSLILLNHCYLRQKKHKFQVE